MVQYNIISTEITQPKYEGWNLHRNFEIYGDKTPVILCSDKWPYGLSGLVSMQIVAFVVRSENDNQICKLLKMLCECSVGSLLQGLLGLFFIQLVKFLSTSLTHCRFLSSSAEDKENDRGLDMITTWYSLK